MHKSKVKNQKNSSFQEMKKDKLRVLPRTQVSEPTRSPFVVWSTRYRIIVSEHSSKQEAVSSLKTLRKDVKAGHYD